MILSDTLRRTADLFRGLPLFLLFISGLAGVLYGVASGNLLAVAMPYFETTMHLGAKQMGLLVSACSLAALISGFLAGPLAEWIGRKKILVASSLFYIGATAVVAVCCGNYWVLFAGLCLQGWAMGLVGTVAPLYLAESLPAEHRGKGTGLFQLFLIGGIVLSGLIGLAVSWLLGAGDDPSVAATTKTLAWQIIFWLGAVPCVIMFFGSLKLPESPEWEGRKGKVKSKSEKVKSVGEGVGAGEDSKRTTARCEDSKRTTARCEDSKRTTARCEDSKRTTARSGVRLTLASLMTRRYVMPFLVVFVILACNKFCGLPCILCYSVKIFNMSGLAKEWANYADVIFKTVMFVMTLIACVLVDVKGRKFLLKLGTGTIFCSLVLISLSFFAIEHGWLPKGGLTGTLVAIGVVVYIAGYSIGPGVCVWLVMTELLPAKIRAVGMGIVLFVNHFVSMGMQYAFLPAGEAIGFGTFWVFCAISGVVYYLTSCFGMPETKGMELSEIEEWYAGEKVKGEG